MLQLHAALRTAGVNVTGESLQHFVDRIDKV
jgi:hypothetical protein